MSAFSHVDPAVADRLDGRRADVAAAWRTQVAEAGLRFDGEGDAVVEAIVRRLRRPEDGALLLAARAHGRRQASRAGGTLGGLVREYALLRQALFEALGDEGADARPVVDAAVDAALGEAADAFEQPSRALAAIVTSHPDLFYLFDRDLRFTWVNGAQLEAWGLTLDAVVGRRLDELGFPADVVARYDADLRRALAGERVRTETAFTRADGNAGCFESMSVPVRDADGAVVGVSGVTRDVTGRRAEEGQLRRVIDAMPQMVWTMTPEGTVERYNDRWYAYTGKPPEEVANPDDWAEIVHPDDLATCRETWARSVAREEPFEVAARLREASGRYRRHLCRARPIRGSDGRIERWVGTSTDVEEQLETQRIRHELHDVFMQSPIPMCTLDGPDFRFTLANPPYLELVARDPTGRTLAEAFLPEEVREFMPILERVYRTGQPYLGREVPFRRRGTQGTVEERTLNFGYHPLLGADGKPYGVLAFVEDVTELVQARRGVEAFVEAMPQMAFIADAEGAITFFNRRWYDYVGGMTGTEGWGWKDQPVHHPDDLARTIATWNHAVATGTPYEIEYRLRRHDGTYRWFLGRAVPIRDEAGRLVRWVGTNTDIEDGKQAATTLQEAVRALEQERELRERFVATLSHDLRTPLTAARMSAQLVPRRLGDPDAAMALAARIATNLDRADRMIRDLLDANRIRAGETLALERRPCDLAEVVRGVVEELGTLHGDRFVVENSGETAGNWDAEALRRVAENLLSNAVKYGAPAEPVTVRVRGDGPSVELSVHNHGPAIPPEDQAALFQPFRRAGGARVAATKGWGLGLTLVKGIAAAHGGEVGVQSEPGTGTTFRVRLPRGG